MIKIDKRKNEFKKYGGVLKTLEFNELGFSSRQINKLMEEGIDIYRSVIVMANYEDISYKVVPNKEVNLSDFSLEELGVLETVATTFKSYKSREIINYMHKEKADMDTEPYQMIPYSLSEKLRELR